jgi:hypothetical protein
VTGYNLAGGRLFLKYRGLQIIVNPCSSPEYHLPGCMNNITISEVPEPATVGFSGFGSLIVESESGCQGENPFIIYD